MASFNDKAVICLLPLLLYFVWMDVKLYLKIQATSISVYSGKHSTPSDVHDDLLFSPFAGFSVKMVLLDHASNHLFDPLAHAFENITNFSKTFPSVTPDMISAAGVFFACVSARLILSHDIVMHRLAVLVFQMRIFCDATDGLVARRRAGINKQVSLFHSRGFTADAVADTLGVAVVLIACFSYLHSIRMRKNLHYLPLQNSEHEKDKRQNSESSRGNKLCRLSSHCSRSEKHVFLVVSCFAVQLLMTAVLWNRYVEQFQILLETPAMSERQAERQNEVFHAPGTLILMWFWRISSGHSLTNMLLLSVMFNKLWEFLLRIQWIGMIELIVLGMLTEMHVQEAFNYIHAPDVIFTTEG